MSAIYLYFPMLSTSNRRSRLTPLRVELALGLTIRSNHYPLW